MGNWWQAPEQCDIPETRSSSQISSSPFVCCWLVGKVIQKTFMEEKKDEPRSVFIYVSAAEMEAESNE